MNTLLNTVKATMANETFNVGMLQSDFLVTILSPTPCAAIQNGRIIIK